MLEFDIDLIKESIPTYKRIMNMVPNVINFETDTEFQRVFKGYFIQAPHKEQWYKIFFKIFQEAKENDYSFEQVLFKLFYLTGEVHLSYCSKLYHVLHPESPIIDKYILWKLGFNPSISFGKNVVEHLNYAISVYNETKDIYMFHMYDNMVRDAFIRFDKAFPEYKNISREKKLDFILWSKREFRIKSIFE